MEIEALDTVDAEELYRVSRRGFEQFTLALATHDRQQTAAKDAEIERLTAIAGDLTDRNDALTDESCKLQDDVASIVSSHRSDWSWDDVLSDARALKEWAPVSEAPRTGEHILVTALGKGGFGTCSGVVQDICAVVHWWDHPGEEGWYLSLGNDDNAQLWPTHFKRLKAGKD